jgi:hypothetical protein
VDADCGVRAADPIDDGVGGMASPVATRAACPFLLNDFLMVSLNVFNGFQSSDQPSFRACCIPMLDCVLKNTDL